MSFRCPGQTALRQADAQRLVLIADACQWRWCRNDTSSSLHRLLNSQLGCSRCQCFTPETLVRVVISRRAGKKQEKLQDNCILIIWVLNFFFQNFLGSGAGFGTEIAAGRGKIGRQAACAGVGTNIIFSKPHRKPAKLTVVIHSTDKEKEIQRGEATFPRSRSL